jgi:hypothetical protein
MGILYDQGFNGGFAEILLTANGATPAIGSAFTAADGFALTTLEPTGAKATGQISIVAINWTINGGGFITLYPDDQASDANDIMTLSGNGSWGIGTHNVNFANIKPPVGKGVRLVDDTNVSAYTVIIKVKKEAGFGNP